MKKAEIKNILINWLAEEYTDQEAERQIKNAKITRIKNKVKIIYNNGVIDIVEIQNNEIKHLNPLRQ
jgi:hypothetical protein